MKVLFITTFQQCIPHEHVFTRNVWLRLREEACMHMMNIYVDPAGKEPRMDYSEAEKTYSLYLPESVMKHREQLADCVASYFKEIGPDVIHSNMIEGFDIEAANKLGIPIVLTMHIGGLICPRGGGNGFLRWDDSICNGRVGADCRKCMCYELPFPRLANLADHLIPASLERWVLKQLGEKRLFYISPLFNIGTVIQERVDAIETLKKAHIITANRKLQAVLSQYDIPTKLIKHGIKEIPRVDYPEVQPATKLKFFYLGRIQYAKGLHVLFKALRGIPTAQYEFHVYGDAYQERREQRYKKRLLKLAQGVNVIFHGSVDNATLREHLKGMHVMVHPAICHEVYGIAISEALSVGRPVLATQCGGTEMQIEDGVNGWLVEPNDVEALHRKISEVIANKEALPSMSKHCSCPETLEQYISELMAYYQKLAASCKVYGIK